MKPLKCHVTHVFLAMMAWTYPRVQQDFSGAEEHNAPESIALKWLTTSNKHDEQHDQYTCCTYSKGGFLTTMIVNTSTNLSATM